MKILKQICVIAIYTLTVSQTASADGLLAIVNPVERTLPAANLELAVSGQYFAASDYTSIRHFTNDWSGTYTPRGGNNLAVSFARADVSVQHDSWSVGYFYRQQILLESNKDMTDIAYANQTRTPVQAGRLYDFSLAMNGFDAQGIRLDKSFAWKMENALDVTIAVGASLMDGQHARFGQAQGSALSTSTGYTYNANLTDANSQKTYPFMPPGGVSGTGYAFDFGLRLQWEDSKRLDVAINDLAGQMNWKNLPLMTMNANSATSARDAQGYLVFNPAISGQNQRIDITQTLDPKASIQFHSPIGYGVSANLGTEWIKGYLFPRFGIESVMSNGADIVADYDERFKTFGLSTKWKYVYLSFRTENISLDQSKGYGISTGLAITF